MFSISISKAWLKIILTANFCRTSLLGLKSFWLVLNSLKILILYNKIHWRKQTTWMGDTIKKESTRTQKLLDCHQILKLIPWVHLKWNILYVYTKVLMLNTALKRKLFYRDKRFMNSNVKSRPPCLYHGLLLYCL